MNLTEEANLSLSSSGNASEAGYYQGNLTISWDNQSIDIPLALNVNQVQSFDGELEIAILASDAGMSTDNPEYTVKIWDRDNP